jgi:hypothetical protein
MTAPAVKPTVYACTVAAAGERAADLLGGVDHGRRYPGVGVLDAEGAGGERGGKDAGRPGAGRNESGQHVGGVAAAGCQPGEDDHRDDAQDHADRDHGAGPEAGQNLGLDQGRDDDDGTGEREEPEAGSDRGEMQDLLHVEGHEQEDRK